RLLPITSFSAAAARRNWINCRMESSGDTIETLFSAAFGSGKPIRTPAGRSGKSCEKLILSCRAKSRHPVKLPVSCGTGCLDFARNDHLEHATLFSQTRRSRFAGLD